MNNGGIVMTSTMENCLTVPLGHYSPVSPCDVTGMATNGGYSPVSPSDVTGMATNGGYSPVSPCDVTGMASNEGYSPVSSCNVTGMTTNGGYSIKSNDNVTGQLTNCSPGLLAPPSYRPLTPPESSPHYSVPSNVFQRPTSPADAALSASPSDGNGGVFYSASDADLFTVPSPSLTVPSPETFLPSPAWQDEQDVATLQSQMVSDPQLLHDMENFLLHYKESDDVSVWNYDVSGANVSSSHVSTTADVAIPQDESQQFAEIILREFFSNYLVSSRDPHCWAEQDVRTWLVFIVQRFGLDLKPSSLPALDGRGLMASEESHLVSLLGPQLTEARQFLYRVQTGPQMFSVKQEAEEGCPQVLVTPPEAVTSQSLMTPQPLMTSHAYNMPASEALEASTLDFILGSIGLETEGLCPQPAPSAPPAYPITSPAPSYNPPSHNVFAAKTSDDGATSDNEEAPRSPPASGRHHIQLYQFLKLMLNNHRRHGASIRWINREEGIFKIENSTEVARQWGIRKNRPKMNYDKMSRSIRQYYDKGVMKKTSRPQRLVYQFCAKYAQ